MRGTNDESKLTPGGLDDLFVIMYTSGTTGDPKGVMLKNSALMASIAASDKFFQHYHVEFSNVRKCSKPRIGRGCRSFASLGWLT